MKLTPTQIKQISEHGSYGDGQGLYLFVSKTGTKSWVYRFQLNGKRREMGLGGFPAISLSKARAERDKQRLKVKAGIDPLLEKKQNKAAQMAASQDEERQAMTFELCTDQFLKIKYQSLRNEKHKDQWANTLRDYAYPVVGDVPVAEIDLHHIERILTPIWLSKTETATRVRSRIEAVLDYARVKQYRFGENPAVWKGNLDKVLPSPGDIRKQKPRKHHSAMPHSELPEFIERLTNQPGNGARALELTILCATRTSETLGAKWEEFDFDKKVWVIPKERMKAGVEHRVPLSQKAIELLNNQKTDEGSEYVFPGQKRGHHLSNMAMTTAMRRMDMGHYTVHGFRSTFRVWVEEESHYPHRVAETALAHQLKDKVEAAYNRTNLFEKRIPLMEDWAGYCYPAKSDKVIDFKRA